MPKFAPCAAKPTPHSIGWISIHRKRPGITQHSQPSSAFAAKRRALASVPGPIGLKNQLTLCLCVRLTSYSATLACRCRQDPMCSARAHPAGVRPRRPVFGRVTFLSITLLIPQGFLFDPTLSPWRLVKPCCHRHCEQNPAAKPRRLSFSFTVSYSMSYQGLQKWLPQTFEKLPALDRTHTCATRLTDRLHHQLFPGLAASRQLRPRAMSCPTP